MKRHGKNLAMTSPHDRFVTREGCLQISLAIAVALSGFCHAQGGQLTVTSIDQNSAVQMDELSKSYVEVRQAIKSFEKRDLETCLQQLSNAVKSHPELPPAHALLAKLAFLNNQPALIHSSLERAVVEDPEH